MYYEVEDIDGVRFLSFMRFAFVYTGLVVYLSVPVYCFSSAECCVFYRFFDRFGGLNEVEHRGAVALVGVCLESCDSIFSEVGKGLIVPSEWQIVGKEIYFLLSLLNLGQDG